MQNGRIKHYNNDKGYGFIKVDNAKGDVFFHISKWPFIEPPQVGQQVYFISDYDDKQQLRVTQMDTKPINQNTTNANSSKSKNTSGTKSPQSTKLNNTTPNSKNNWLTTAIAIVIILSAVLFGSDFLSQNASAPPDIMQSAPNPSINISQQSNRNSVVSNHITGDVQIDNTIALIKQGGPFPYPDKDGTTFYNREGKLPTESRGYYREYTVPTPNVSHRGARRIVTGGNPPNVYYLTLDHYETFKKLNVD